MALVPTVLRDKGHRFFFFSRELDEPPHIHVEKGGAYAKYWLQPVALARNQGFRMHELNEVRRIVEKNADLFRERWNEHSGLAE